jgi:hypothetical protein
MSRASITHKCRLASCLTHYLIHVKFASLAFYTAPLQNEKMWRLEVILRIDCMKETKTFQRRMVENHARFLK